MASRDWEKPYNISIHKGALVGLASLHQQFTLKEDVVVEAKRYRKNGRTHYSGWKFQYRDMKCWVPFNIGRIISEVVMDLRRR